MLIAVSAGAVWMAIVSLAQGRSLIAVSIALVLGLTLLDPAGMRSPRRRSLATLRVARVALVLLCGGVVFQATGSKWTVALGVIIGTLALIAEEIVVRAKKRPALWSSNIPGAPAALKERALFAAIVPLSLVTALVAILPAVAGSFSIWLVVVIGWMAFVIFTTAVGVLDRLSARRQEPQLYAAVKKFDPEMIVFTSRPDDASYQILMWLPFLQKTGKRLLIMATSQVAARALSEKTDVPVVLRRNVAAFEEMAGPSLGAIFYVNASSGNNMMIRYNQYQHVYLGHGDSDKPPSYNPTHAMYDHIFAAGQGAIDRYASHGVVIPREKFKIVGRPQVAEIDVASSHADGDIKTVLYAPTWRGHVEETMFHSVPQGEAIVDELLRRNLRVLFRPHPFSYEFPEDAAIIARIHATLDSHRRESGIEHLWGAAAEQEMSIVECINESDAMISDVSSVVSDYLYSGKPFIMMAISTPVADFATEYPIARGAYVVGAGLDELDSALNEMTGADPLRTARSRVRAYYLGDFAAEDYEKHFIAAARSVTQTGQEPAATSSPLEGNAKENRVENGEESEPLELETAHNLLSVTRYRLRLLRRLTGSRRLREQESMTLVGLVAWSVMLIYPSAVATALLLVVAAGSAIIFWVNMAKRSISLRRTVGSDAALFLFLTLAAAINSAPELRGGYLLLLAALALNHETRALQGIRAVVARNLPGLRVAMDTQPPAGAVASVALWVSLLFGVVNSSFESVAGSEAPWLITAGVTLFVSLIAFVSATRSLQASRKDARDLAQLVTDYGPEFAVYFASKTGGRYQYGMWEPYFQRLDKRYIVIVRDRRSAREISRLTNAPVIFRPTLRSLDDVVPPSVGTVFYVNNAVKNTHMVERPGLTNVWLNHGDSEKPACYNPVHAMYDLIFAAGEAGIDRYARHGVVIPREKFIVTGRPQVENIERAQTAVANSTEQTVLYAPTWIGPYKDANVYSLPVATEVVSNLLQRGVRVIFRAHPLNYRYAVARGYITEVQELLELDARRTGREHLWGDAAEKELTIEECFNHSDALISDISAVVSDYLQAEKPLAIMAMNMSADQIRQQIPAAGAAYVISGDLSDLDERLDQLLQDDPLANARKDMRIYYLGDFASEDYASGFLGAARGVIDAAAPVRLQGSH